MNVRCSLFLAVSVCLSLAYPHPACGQNWLAMHGTAQEYETWRRGKSKNYRVVYLNGFDAGSEPRFSALAVPNEPEIGSHANYNSSLAEITKVIDEYKGKGYRPISVSGYLKGKEPAFAIVWICDKQPTCEKIALNLSEKEYQERIILERKKGFMPRMTTGYADGIGSYRFTALFVPAGGVVWQERHDLTEEQYQKRFDESAEQNLRPLSISVYPTPEGLRFAAVFIRDQRGYQGRHHLSATGYEAECRRMKKEGFSPVSVVGYVTGGSSEPHEFNAAMARFMAERQVPLGTFAVSRAGKLLHEGGLRLRDVPGQRPDANVPMRLASVTKPITAAAIRVLIREGKLSLDTPALPLLGLKPPPGQKLDPRLNRITIQHLLEHKGGWDREKSYDPMFRPREIAAALKVPCPPSPVDVIRFMLGQPLQFDPGSRAAYSNFGYCILGRVIEKVTGRPYVAYVQKHILAPLGIKSVELGRSLPAYRNPREPVYSDPRRGRNVFDAENKEEVPLPDGTFDLEAMDAHGGLIGSSRDLVKFLDAYWTDGEPRNGEGRSYSFFGELPGTFTMVMQRPNGVNVAVLFNQSKDSSGLAYRKIEETMRALADRQVREVRYAAAWVKE